MGRTVTFAVIGMLGCGRFAFDPTSTNTCDEPAIQEELPVVGAARYVAPTGGSDANPGTEAAPWATIAFALTAVAADETIVLLDGVYSERLRLNVSGRRVVAANDGRAIFDGGGTVVPCDITADAVTLEGVHCRNGTPAAVSVLNASKVVIRRVTAHTAVSRYVFRLQFVTDVLLEDVAAWGPATNDYFIADSMRTTLRRCWARWETTDDMYSASLVLTTNAFDSVVENCIVMSSAPYDAVKSTMGIHLGSTTGQTDRNRLFGNVVYGIPNWAAVTSTEVSRVDGNRFTDTVLLESGGGFFQRSDADFGVDRLTSVQMAGAGAVVVQAHSMEPKDAGFGIAGYIRDSVLGMAPEGFFVFGPYITNVTHTNNTLFDVTMPYRGDIIPDPSETLGDPMYDVATYGRGAYLIQNSLGTGAEILKRYEDGVLTDEPLWPWPLEERILRESGSSVTYVSGGGIWKTLPAEACP